MGYINVFVGSECTIKLKNKQLLLNKNDNSASYPLEDLNSVLIENNNCVVTIKCLTELVKHNVLVYVCDEKHLPASYLLGYNSFYTNLTAYNYQINNGKPFLKQLWKSVVKHKILNQIKVLELNCIQHDLTAYIEMVKSDDSDNVESVVANKYFKLLFGKNFVRRNDVLINSALNYGYAIIRGAIARTVVAHGLQPFIGIHHSNYLNNFNLVDDLIEPFRPVVDLFVYNNFYCVSETELSPAMKLSLHNLLNADVLIGGSKYSVSYAVELYVESVVQSFKTQKNLIRFPEIKEIEIHKYE